MVVAGCGDDGDSAAGTGCTQVAVNVSSGEGLAEVLVVADDGEPRLVTGDWVATEPSLSPDGRSVVVVRADGDYESAGPESTALWVVGTDGTGARALTEGPTDDTPAWSPDGSQVAYTSRTGGHAMVVVVPAGGGEARTVVDVPGTPYTTPAWSPDGERVAVISHRPDQGYSLGVAVWTVDADGTDLRDVATVGGAHSLDWHADGVRVLVGTTGRNGAYLVDVDTGDAREVDPSAGVPVWSGDHGAVVYFADDDADPAGERWRPAHGRIEDGALVHERFVDDIANDVLYPYLGIDAGPCAPGG